MTPRGPALAPELTEVVDDEGRRLIRVSGAWTLQALAPRMENVERAITGLREPHAAVWDMGQVSSMDHLGAALLLRARGQGARDIGPARPEHLALFRRLERREQRPDVVPRRAVPIWLAPGVQVLRALDHLRDIV